jgi:hypothetical protein
LLSLSGCGQNPRVDVSAAIENGQVVFNISHSGINGILGVGVKDGDKTLWAVSTSYEKGHKITYGLLPTGGNMTAMQTIPEQGEGPPDIRGKTVTVSISYQYDRPFAPCSGSAEKALVIPKE